MKQNKLRITTTTKADRTTEIRQRQRRKRFLSYLSCAGGLRLGWHQSLTISVL